MILLIDSAEREGSVLAELCAGRGWVTEACATVAAARRRIPRLRPRVAVIRRTLRDGLAEEVLAALADARCRRLVLVPAGTSGVVEARLVALGADCVLREPLRIEVLLAYLERFRGEPGPAARPAPARLAFAGGRLDPADRTLRRGARRTTLAPREAQLAELLARAPAEVVAYEVLYAEILGRPFRGDTGNLRVLLGKLCAAAARAGVDARAWIEVIPKSGYRLRRAAARA
ncbi:MAG: winged helix-turn-helix domain-containing protein [Verrucomicrobiota bacterium]